MSEAAQFWVGVLCIFFGACPGRAAWKEEPDWFSFLLLVVAPIALGLFVLFDLYQRERVGRLLARQGRLATGIVFGREKITTKKGTLHLISYVFRPAEGGPVITKTEVADSFLYENSRVGTPVCVRYLPRKPKGCELLGLA